MSRGYNARKKAKRQARAVEPRPRVSRFGYPRFATLLPVAAIIAVLVAVGASGFGANSGKSRQQITGEVTALLAGIPQEGSTLGAPKAPITLQMFGDLECPTVKLYVETYLTRLIDTWVRSGLVKIEYRSLQTDTLNEHTFFRQEVAALAAGRQDKMWNFLLTFVHEQEPEYTAYATESFLTEIASQVPRLKLAQWRRDQKNALLSRRVALGIYSAHARTFHSTPSFRSAPTKGEIDIPVLSGGVVASLRNFETSLTRDVESLGEQATQDDPDLDLAERKESREILEK